MDRCKLFSKLTKSSDEECTLFEELLERFFEEYNSLYGAMNDIGVVDEVADIVCLDDNEPSLKIQAVFNKKIKIEKTLMKSLKDFLSGELCKKHSVNIDKINSDTILITLVKKG